MNLSLKEIAQKLKGSIEDDVNFKITQLSKIEDAQSGSLSFLANKKYTPYLYKTNASAVLIHKNFKLGAPVKCALIRVDDPYASFTTLLVTKLVPLLGDS